MTTIVVILIFVALVMWFVLKKRPETKVQTSAQPPRYLSSSTVLRETPASSFQWQSLGDFEFEVVGESNYQRVIATLAGEHGSKSAEKQCVAELIPENENPHDPKAVAVKIQGEVVGYFSRQDARSFRRRLGQKGFSDQITTCDAMIVGGGTKRSGDKLHYGVRLDIKPFGQ